MKTKFMVLLKRKAGLTLEQFRDHYENHHVPLAEPMIGHLLVSFQRLYPGEMSDFAADDWTDGRLGGGAPDGCGYDAIGIYTFRDDAAMAELAEILKRTEIQKALVEDENRFLDRKACRMGLCGAVEGQGMVVT